MKSLLKTLLLIVLLAASAATAYGQYGLICGDPSQKLCVGQYDDFRLHDLIFNTGRAALGAGTRHESNEFYAVILESVAARKKNESGCVFISETKRMAAQSLFPKNKVFASRQRCRGTIVGYTEVSEDFNFMAVYAGETKAQAAKILARAKKSYPQANIRKMQVALDFSDE